MKIKPYEVIVFDDRKTEEGGHWQSLSRIFKLKYLSFRLFNMCRFTYEKWNAKRYDKYCVEIGFISIAYAKDR